MIAGEHSRGFDPDVGLIAAAALVVALMIAVAGVALGAATPNRYDVATSEEPAVTLATWQDPPKRTAPASPGAFMRSLDEAMAR